MKRVLLLIISFLAINTTFAQSLTDSLYAWYPFNGNAHDESGHGHNPVFNTATLCADKDGHANNAYVFTGSDSIIMTNMNYKNITGLSFSFWMKTTGDQNLMALVSCSPNVFYLGKFTPNHVMAAFDANSSNNDPSNETTTDCAANTWIHVAATNNGSLTSLYVNGTLEASYSETLVQSVNQKMYLGYYHNIADGYVGFLDEVRVYTRALTSTEVSELYNLGTPSSVQDIQVPDPISIYPNPSVSGQFQVNSGKILSDAVITVSNISGQVVYSENPGRLENYPVNISNCQKGVYFVRIISGNDVFVKQVILD